MPRNGRNLHHLVTGVNGFDPTAWQTLNEVAAGESSGIGISDFMVFRIHCALSIKN
jgi:hypothetical protein